MEHKPISKSKLNLSIDIILLLLLAPLAGIGFLMEYVLVPGFKRNAIYGSNVELEFLGLSRHEWGNIHFIISLIFIGLMVFHIIFHWSMIVSIFKRMVPNRTLRIVLTSLLTVVSLLLIAFPLVIKPEIIGSEPLHRNRDSHENGLEAASYEKSEGMLHADSIQFQKENRERIVNNDEHNHSENKEFEVYGNQTLQFVADKYQVPASKIAVDLKIPETLVGEKLGRLKKTYDFTMEDVSKSIAKNGGKKE